MEKTLADHLHSSTGEVNIFLQETVLPGSLETSFKQSLKETNFNQDEAPEDLNDQTFEMSLAAKKMNKLQLIYFIYKKAKHGLQHIIHTTQDRSTAAYQTYLVERFEDKNKANFSRIK